MDYLISGNIIFNIRYKTEYIIAFFLHFHSGKKKYLLFIFHTRNAGLIPKKLTFGNMSICGAIFT